VGLFGSVGKVFGGALKVAGKVAGVASAVAPIPGLGFAGKVAGRLGGVLNRANKVRSQVQLIQSAASGGQLKPGTIAGLSPVMPGGAVLTGGGGARTGAQLRTWGVGKLAGYTGAPKKRRKRRKSVLSGGRRRRRRRRSGLSRAQLRAGFGGKRRMRG